MDCLHPVQVWLCGQKACKSDGVISPHLEFSSRKAMDYFRRIGYPQGIEHNAIMLPCGKCLNCLMLKRKEMSVRLAHEASMHEECCFLTLTYNSQSCPVTDWRKLGDGKKLIERGEYELPEKTLLVSDVQKFLKRLRSWLDYHEHRKIRYFAVGEYGSKNLRPHYHVLIFGWSPKDKEFYYSKNGNIFYRSKTIEKLWKYGFSTVSDVSPSVAKYCARYVTKKFARLDKSDPFDDCRLPEFTLQSKMHGGIGATWFDRFGADACRVGFCTLRTSLTRVTKYSIPQYYWSRLRQKNLPVWLSCRDERLSWRMNHPTKYDFGRCVNKAECLRLQLAAERERESEL